MTANILHSDASRLVDKMLFFLIYSAISQQLAIGITNSVRSGNFPQYLAKNRTLPEAAAASNVTEENRNGRNVFWGAFRMYFGLYSVLQGYCVLSYEVNYILTSE